MKRILIYIVILIAVLLVPLERTDVGKLRPVQTAVVSWEDEDYVITTDTGDRGAGRSIEAALEDLKNKTPAIIYLDTAQFLLIAKDTSDAVEPLRQYFKGNVQVFGFRGTVDPKVASQYLAVHGGGMQLKDWKSYEKLPLLLCKDEEMVLVED